jgi:hypothetical protein
MSNSFENLIEDLGRQADLDLQVDEQGALSLRMEDGIVLSLSYSGEDVFAVFADTSIARSTLRASAFAELADLFLQINFATSLSSRFSVALSSEGTVVMMCTDHVSRISGQHLFVLIESLLNKCRMLRETISEFANAPPDPASGMAAMHEAMGRFV